MKLMKWIWISYHLKSINNIQRIQNKYSLLWDQIIKVENFNYNKPYNYKGKFYSAKELSLIFEKYRNSGKESNF